MDILQETPPSIIMCEAHVHKPILDSEATKLSDDPIVYLYLGIYCTTVISQRCKHEDVVFCQGIPSVIHAPWYFVQALLSYRQTLK